ncbi:MAG: vWA domain-containing protein [Acidobacteriota bacterium]|nr:vWA domain-containing protein [Acidobacteriota bacterium]
MMKITISALTVLLFALIPLHASKRAARIQVALLLDTSGSMDGLIDQARTRLWHVVNELARTKKLGVTAHLEVALYEYGKSSIPAERGHLRRIVPLTTDLDKISEELFALTTNGGEEYCGLVIDHAVKDLDWSKSPGDYKAIFIAGNEAFNQGSTDFRAVCSNAIAQGIMVNTIFCGDETEGRNTFWKEGADLADGCFMTIDQNRAVAAIEAPQDAEILALGRKLNRTYVARGSSGVQGIIRQKSLDRQLEKKSKEAAVQRTMVKASPAYEARDWDLVSAAEADDEALAEIAEEELPEEMKDMKPKERKQYLNKKMEERRKLQTRLEELRKERQKYVAQQRAQATDSLDSVMLAAVRKQLEKLRFSLTKP